MFPRNNRDTWGPECRLVRIFAKLRQQTAHGRMQPAGIGKLYSKINETGVGDEAMQTTPLTKGRIGQLLAGDGNPPTWEEANTMYRTLKRIALEGAGTEIHENEDEDTEEFRRIVEATDVSPSYYHEAASHFATKILHWGRENCTWYINKYLDEVELSCKQNGYSRSEENIRKTREELNNNSVRSDKVIEGAVAVTHTSPTPPVYYQDVFNYQMVLDLTEFQEQKIMRLDGHQINVKVDYLETGIRITYVICNNHYVKGFVAIEVSSSGSVAAYFRWIPVQKDKKERLVRLVAWGLAGSIRLCIHTHVALGASGIMNSYLLLPEHNLDESKNFYLAPSELHEYQNILNATITLFEDIIKILTGESDVANYLTESKHKLWSEHP